MNRIRATLRRLYRNERGEAPLMLLMLVPALFLVIGLVVDAGGKIQASSEATLIAQSAARAGVNAGITSAPGGGIAINGYKARHGAQQFLADSGATGNVVVDSNSVTVKAVVTYDPRLLPVGGLDGSGIGTAEARTAP